MTVWRSGRIFCTMRMICGSNPMSNMRSASSSTCGRGGERKGWRGGVGCGRTGPWRQLAGRQPQRGSRGCLPPSSPLPATPRTRYVTRRRLVILPPLVTAGVGGGRRGGRRMDASMASRERAGPAGLAERPASPRRSPCSACSAALRARPSSSSNTPKQRHAPRMSITRPGCPKHRLQPSHTCSTMQAPASQPLAHPGCRSCGRACRPRSRCRA